VDWAKDERGADIAGLVQPNDLIHVHLPDVIQQSAAGRKTELHL